MAELNVGVIGLGWVAGAHIDAFKQVVGARVTTVCSRREHDLADLEKQYGIPLKPYRDIDAFLADDSIDIVSICTPHVAHKEQIIKAARAGKHLVIEKPITLSFEDMKEVRAVLDETGVKTCVCFECRFSMQFKMIRSLIDRGLLGDVHYGEVDYYHGVGPWYPQFEWYIKKDMGGSNLLSAGCHALDALLYFMDDEVVEVTSHHVGSQNRDFSRYEYPTTSVLMLQFASGRRIAKCTSSIDCFQPYYFHVHLVGSEGSVLDNKFYSNRIDGLNRNQWSTLATSLVDSGDVHDHPYLSQFQVFVDSIASDRTMPLTDFDTAVETHRVVFAADLSARENRPVKMAEME